MLSGTPSVPQALDVFYQELFVRMFMLLNPQYTLSDEYMRCMRSTVNTLQPFGEHPAKMRREVRLEH